MSNRPTSSARLLLRIVVGASALAVDRVRAELQALHRAVLDENRGVPASDLDGRAPRPRHAIIGAIVDASSQLVGLDRPIRSVLAQAGRALSRANLGPSLPRPLRNAYAGLMRRSERWAQLGLREEAAARQLVRLGLEDLFSRGARQLATRPELQTLIREQSAGLAKTALDGLRHGGKRADQSVDDVLGRLVRRRKREPEPPPRGEDGR